MINYREQAEQVIADRVRVRNNHSPDARSFIALEAIADEMTRLVAEIRIAAK
jgi:hypothetical protein